MRTIGGQLVNTLPQNQIQVVQQPQIIQQPTQVVQTGYPTQLVTNIGNQFVRTLPGQVVQQQPQIVVNGGVAGVPVTLSPQRVVRTAPGLYEAPLVSGRRISNERPLRRSRDFYDRPGDRGYPNRRRGGWNDRPDDLNRSRIDTRDRRDFRGDRRIPEGYVPPRRTYTIKEDEKEVVLPTTSVSRKQTLIDNGPTNKSRVSTTTTERVIENPERADEGSRFFGDDDVVEEIVEEVDEPFERVERRFEEEPGEIIEDVETRYIEDPVEAYEDEFEDEFDDAERRFIEEPGERIRGDFIEGGRRIAERPVERFEEAGRRVLDAPRERFEEEERRFEEAGRRVLDAPRERFEEAERRFVEEPRKRFEEAERRYIGEPVERVERFAENPGEAVEDYVEDRVIDAGVDRAGDLIDDGFRRVF